MEINIKYRIIVNGFKLLKTIKDKNKTSFILEDNSIIRRNEIFSISSQCDECSFNVVLKNIPDNNILNNDKYLCKVCRNKGVNNPQFGKIWDCNRKKERSDKYSGVNNPMYGINLYEKWIEKYGIEITKEKIKENKKKHSNNSSGENNPMYGKKYYDIWVEKYGEEEAVIRQLNKINKNREWLNDNPDQLNKMIINSHKGKYRKTSIEVKIENYLIENNLKYKYNFIMDNKYQFDFLIKDRNIIIETHGDYWHANPNTYSDLDSTKKNLNDQQRYKVNLDNDKLIYLKERNYEIIYLWETEIKNNDYKKILKEWNL